MHVSCVLGNYSAAVVSYVLWHVEQTRMIFYGVVRRLVIRSTTGENQRTCCMLYALTVLVKCLQ